LKSATMRTNQGGREFESLRARQSLQVHSGQIEHDFVYVWSDQVRA
jgi:hypothetical protein